MMIDFLQLVSLKSKIGWIIWEVQKVYFGKNPTTYIKKEL